MNLHFQYLQFIWILAGIAVFILLFFALLSWKRRVKKQMGDPELVNLLIKGFSPFRFAIKFFVICLAFAAGVLAVMNLREPSGKEGITRKGIDLVVAMDVSKSMLATDLPPNRLERAKQFVSRLINAMPEDRIGLILFAGRAYMQMPLSTDHGAAQLYVSSASPDAVPQQGTVIGQALTMSNRVFSKQDRRFKAVVLISDGEDHDEEAIELSKKLAQQGMMINTIGIGSADGSYIPDPATGANKLDASGSQVITKLNESELKEIATNTNGIYIKLASSDDAVNELKQHLQQIDSIAYGDLSMMNYTSYFIWFVALMLGLLVLDLFIPESFTKRKVKLA